MDSWDTPVLAELLAQQREDRENLEQAEGHQRRRIAALKHDLSIVEDIDVLEGLISVLGIQERDLGVLLGWRDETREEALALLSGAYEELTRIGETLGAGMCQVFLSRVQQLKGNPGEARRSLSVARSCFTQIEHVELIAFVDSLLADS